MSEGVVGVLLHAPRPRNISGQSIRRKDGTAMRVAGSDVRAMGRVLEILDTVRDGTEDGTTRDAILVTTNTLALIMRTMRETE